MPEQYDAPEFLAAVQTIFDKARKYGRGAGMHFWGDPDQQVRFLEMGCNFLIHSADLLLARDHLADELNAVRQRMGDLPQGGGGPDLTI
jgi:4-hydroxy-2-oxoheptanedioate aldolase